jgi:hypothetical protein
VTTYWVLVPDWMRDPNYEGYPYYDFQAGLDADGTPLYACVASYEGGTHPGKFRKDFTGCNFGWGSGNVTVAPFGLLTDWQLYGERPHN